MLARPGHAQGKSEIASPVLPELPDSPAQEAMASVAMRVRGLDA